MIARQHCRTVFQWWPNSIALSACIEQSSPEAGDAGQAGQQRRLQALVQQVARQQRRRQLLAQACHAGPPLRAPRPACHAAEVRNVAPSPKAQAWTLQGAGPRNRNAAPPSLKDSPHCCRSSMWAAKPPQLLSKPSSGLGCYPLTAVKRAAASTTARNCTTELRSRLRASGSRRL